MMGNAEMQHRWIKEDSSDKHMIIYAGRTSFFGSEPPLSQGIGYAVVLGFGAAFSILTTLIMYIEEMSTKKKINSEMFK